MIIELFTLCEGAFNTNGRLTIVNTFENIISNQYPWRGQLGIALKLLVPKGEIRDYGFQMRIQNLETKQVFHEINADLKLSQTEDTGDTRIAMATNIQGMLLPSPGEYSVSISIDCNLIQEFPFKVLKHV